MTTAGLKKITDPIRFTKLRADEPISKRIRLDAQGMLSKDSTAMRLTCATLERVTVSARQLHRLLGEVKPAECHVYGIPKSHAASTILARSLYHAAGQPSDATTRTNDAFEWPDGPAVMMLDYDAADEALSREHLLEALYEVCPQLNEAAHVWGASTSSCITNTKTKRPVSGVEGQRVYIVVHNGNDIPRAARALHQRLWIAGYGHIKVSKSGQLLERSLIDRAVFQPSHIDFCAPAACEPPLKQSKPKPQKYGSAQLALDTAAALPDLSPEEEQRFRALLASAKEAKKEEATTARAAYVVERTRALKNAGVNAQQAESTVMAAITQGVLLTDFILTTEEGAQVTVGELLADKERWNGAKFADPLEPEYHDDRRIAMAFLRQGRPVIHSFARGGRVYHLTPAKIAIRVHSGGRRDLMEQVLAGLKRNDAGLYWQAQRLVAVDGGGQVDPLNVEKLQRVLDNHFRLEKPSKKKDEWYAIDIDSSSAKHFLEAYGNRFDPLKGVATAPLYDPRTGRVLCDSGYDEATQLLLQLPEGIVVPSDNPTTADVELALETLWYPLHLFPFAADLDKSIAITAMLTAAIRVLLPTAPGFAFDAPTQGSGKTLLANTVAAVTGYSGTVSPFTPQEEELRKRIFATLQAAKPTVIIDNVLGHVDSASLAAMLTATTYADRVLGESRNATVSTNTLLLLTGNNIVLKGDLVRRVLKCRIAPVTAAPHQRMFPFDPHEHVTRHRQEIVAAAITLMVAACSEQQSGSRLGPGRMASFEEWDDVIRQTVCWVANQQSRGILTAIGTRSNIALPNLVDPMEAVNIAVQEDPGMIQLFNLLLAWEQALGLGSATSGGYTVKELVDAVLKGAYSPNDPLYMPKQQLKSCLEELTDNRAGSIPTRSLARQFIYMQDRIAGGYRLRAGNKYQGAVRWYVEAAP